ncbi:probable disease resistance protein RF9 isoform X2 [Citrus sinensis]|uniref:probable disease resistance protein RF9 isoform X2 n=1 Tax=Citrus sinensis TaxID=2711 RepID=UPI0022780B52|nr:probable disease resistance protein RF9 isoform X2 [Citrus sinensis]
MHDVVRDVAISIASRDRRVFTMRNEVDPRKLPDKYLLKKCSTISLHGNNISEIPQGWECPQLEFFYIFAPEDSPLKIPDNIFMGMPKLKVLHFIRMRLLSLPSSIHLLTDLRTLCLDGCKLEDIRIIGELKELEILSLQGCDIEHLPREIGQLTQLKLLDLSYCFELKVIAPNVLSNLSQLEELYMATCCIKWEVLGLNIERSNASLDELKNLSRLTTLEIHIVDAGILPSELFSRKLERYRIVVGDEWDWFDNYRTRRTLKLKLNSRICLEEWRGLKNVEYLCLEELRDVFHEIIWKNVNQLHTRPSLFNEKVVLPNLEVLELTGINVAKIWHNQLSEMSCNVQNLTRLVVSGCNKLRYVFSSSTAKRLGQLQHFQISNCSLLEEIVGKEGGVEADPSFVFPRLTILQLCYLPELRAFYPGIHTLECPMLTKLKVSCCDKLKCFSSELYSLHENNEEGQLIDVPVPAQQSLFLVEKVLPNLEELRLSNKKDITKIWQGQFPDHLLNKLKVLAIENDKSEVLAPDLLERFHNLVNLELADGSYKELFSNEGQVEKLVGKLARIKCLQLSGLNDLKHLWLWEENSKLNMIFQNLETLDISFCRNLKNLLPSSASFRCLTKLSVWCCEQLINLVTSSAAKNLVQLVTMKVDGCSKITELVVAIEADEANEEIFFPKLESLDLNRLQSLTTFCSANYTFKFPSLCYLSVSACPKMKIFCRGVLSAPRLEKVRLNDQNYWDADLNTIIQQSYYETMIQVNLQCTIWNKTISL